MGMNVILDATHLVFESVTGLFIDNGWSSRQSSCGMGATGPGKRFHRCWSVTGHLVVGYGGVDRVSRHHLSFDRLLRFSPESPKFPTLRIRGIWRWWRTASLYHDLHCETRIAATRRWHWKIGICGSIEQKFDENKRLICVKEVIRSRICFSQFKDITLTSAAQDHRRGENESWINLIFDCLRE